MDRRDVLAKFEAAARVAADIVMRVYSEADLGVEMKGHDDPVTRADKEANAALVDLLARDFPGVPIVAEESDPSSFAGFAEAPCAFFVDPVDGTREFIARNGEFAVMLGLAEHGQATVGVVHCPALSEVFTGAVGLGAFRNGAPIQVASETDLATCRCAVSRFRRSKSVQERLSRLGLRELVEVGSAGIKGARVAAAQLEIYAHPSTGPVKLWDACAPDAIVRAAGGLYTDAAGTPFDYRGALAQGAGTLAANPALHAEALRRWT